jgi:hypothetical protein
MFKQMIFGMALTSMTFICSAKADPIDLTAYVDSNGFLDVQTLTCAQLANTYQEDADALMSWYSGWYNGLAHKHYLDYRKGRIAEHDVIEYCKAHLDQKIVHAIAVVFKDMRAEQGVEMK